MIVGKEGWIKKAKGETTSTCDYNQELIKKEKGQTTVPLHTCDHNIKGLYKKNKKHTNKKFG